MLLLLLRAALALVVVAAVHRRALTTRGRTVKESPLHHEIRFLQAGAERPAAEDVLVHVTPLTLSARIIFLCHVLLEVIRW